MTFKPNTIDHPLCYEDLLFATPADRCRYIGLGSKYQPWWLEQHPDKWWRFIKIPHAPALCSERTEIEGGIASGSSGHPLGWGSECKSETGRHSFTTPGSSPPVDQPQLTAPPISPALSPSESANEQGAIGSNAVGILGISEQVSINSATEDTVALSDPDATPLGLVRRTSGPRDNRRRKNQRSSGGSSKSAPKLSPALMRIVIESLQECSTHAHAAWKAGIHRQTLAYWLKRSKAGDDGYDLVWQGIPGRFHVHCEVAVEMAHTDLLERVLEIGLGVTYPGTKAYVTPPNLKMLELYLKIKLPEKYGKRRNARAMPYRPVLVVGQPGKKCEHNTAASVRARQMKSLSKKI